MLHKQTLQGKKKLRIVEISQIVDFDAYHIKLCGHKAHRALQQQYLMKKLFICFCVIRSFTIESNFENKALRNEIFTISTTQ